MEKTPRYTQRERNMVLGYAAQYKDVIENKRTDAESNRKKDEVWLQIAKEFNSKVYHQRSAKQLRQLYKNMKLLLKKDLCGEDKGNRSFMDLLNTLSQQESVAQYISEQTDGAGSQTAGNGRHLADDYEDSKPHMYEGMDTDVILIKSETISDNEQTENGMDCMDDDDDDDCPSTKVPEVCLEEDDDELFAADLRQLNHGCFPRMNGNHLANGSNLNGNNSNNNNNNNNSNEPLPRASSSPVCSTKTSVSSNGSYMSPGLPKTEITLSSVGNIRVGAFASISKALQNGSNSSNSNSSNNNNNSISCNNNNNNDNNTSNNNTISNGLELTAEQIQQHLLLNGLGLSAVQHPPAHSLQAAINASTSGVGSGSGNGNGNTSTRPTTQMLQLPRLARGHTAGNVLRGGQEATTVTAAAAVAAAAAAAAAAGVAGTNVGSNNVGAGGVQLVLNGHQGNRDKLHAQQSGSTGLSVAAGSFNGYNGLGVTSINAINCAAASNNNMNNSVASSSSSNHNNNNSSANNNNLNNLSSLNTSSSSGGGGTRGQHNEYMMSLAVEERKRKIELINAQIEYWQTLTKKLDSQSGHFPNPACMCHFPGNGVIGAGVAVGASSAAAASALQTQSSSS